MLFRSGLAEAIIPLEQPEVLRKVGASIAAAMPKEVTQGLNRAIGRQDAGVYRPQQAVQSTSTEATSVEHVGSAVAKTVLESVLPMIASMKSSGGDKRPVYVGTLIADDRGLRELNRKMKIVDVQEGTRRG